jgi:hypothetical protein
MGFSLLSFVAAFGGGMFGAIFGALFAYIFLGIMLVVSFVPGGAGIEFMAAGVFGPWYGPHITFAAGLTAAAYAAKRGYIQGGTDILSPLVGLNKPDALLAGGIAGIIGYTVHTTMSALTGPVPMWDNIAFTVLFMGFLSKIVFDGTLTGKTPDAVKQLKGGRFNPSAPAWTPYFTAPLQKALVGIGLGCGASWFTYTFSGYDPVMGSMLPYAIASLLLIGYYLHMPIVPVIHITIVPSLATAALMPVCGQGAILWGIALALISVWIADAGSRVFYLYSNKLPGGAHVDPPTMGIFTCSFLLNGVLVKNPALQSALAIPVIIIIAAVVWGLIHQFTIEAKKPAAAATA